MKLSKALTAFALAAMLGRTSGNPIALPLQASGSLATATLTDHASDTHTAFPAINKRAAPDPKGRTKDKADTKGGQKDANDMLDHKARKNAGWYTCQQCKHVKHKIMCNTYLFRLRKSDKSLTKHVRWLMGKDYKDPTTTAGEDSAEDATEDAQDGPDDDAQDDPEDDPENDSKEGSKKGPKKGSKKGSKQGLEKDTKESSKTGSEQWTRGDISHHRPDGDRIRHHLKKLKRQFCKSKKLRAQLVEKYSIKVPEIPIPAGLIPKDCNISK